MTLPDRMKFGIFMAPFHWAAENPTLSFERDMELLEWLDQLGYDEAWIGEHHSGGWETIASPEIFIGAAAQRTKHIKLGTGVLSLPYHHPLMVANRMIQLDHMTRGRVMMGVGPRGPCRRRLHARHRPSPPAPAHGRGPQHHPPPLDRDRPHHLRSRLVYPQGGHRPPSSIYSASYPRRSCGFLLSRRNGLRR